MSNRSMIEINHDYYPHTDAEQQAFLYNLLCYLRSGNPRNLPDGVTWFDMRHHSDPCPLGSPPLGWRNEMDQRPGRVGGQDVVWFDKIETLYDFCDDLVNGHAPRALDEQKSLLARALAAESSLNTAVEALKPFADALQDIEDNVSDDASLWESPAAMNLYVKDLRRASAIRSRAVGGNET